MKERKFYVDPTQKSFPRYFGRKAGRATKILGKRTIMPFSFIKFYLSFWIPFKSKSFKKIACSGSCLPSKIKLVHFICSTSTTFQLLCKVPSLFFLLIWVSLMPLNKNVLLLILCFVRVLCLLGTHYVAFASL